MPVTFPPSSPNTDRAEYPRAPTLASGLRVSADQSRSNDELIKTWQEENYGDSWAYATHIDPQQGWKHKPTGLDADTTDDGPQPTDERSDGPTLPTSTSHAPRITDVD